MAKVKIYSTTHCPYCLMVKDYLKQKNVAFEEVNVETDEQAAMEMVSKTNQMGVPVTDIDGKIVIGFDKAGIDRALGI